MPFQEPIAEILKDFLPFIVGFNQILFNVRLVDVFLHLRLSMRLPASLDSTMAIRSLSFGPMCSSPIIFTFFDVSALFKLKIRRQIYGLINF
jgi:hypothetical protein